LASLVHGILNQRQAAEFPNDEHIGDAGLKFRRELRHIRAMLGVAHHHGDRPDRTCLRAKAMANALVTALTMTAWPASIARTSPSGQTVVHVAQPMQCVVSICGCCDCGPVRTQLPLARLAGASLLSPALRFEISPHVKERNDRGNQEAEKVIREVIHIAIFSQN